VRGHADCIEFVTVKCQVVYFITDILTGAIFIAFPV